MSKLNKIAIKLKKFQKLQKNALKTLKDLNSYLNETYIKLTQP